MLTVAKTVKAPRPTSVLANFFTLVTYVLSQAAQSSEPLKKESPGFYNTDAHAQRLTNRSPTLKTTGRAK